MNGSSTSPRTHRLTLHPGDKVEIDLIEPLVNGYPDHLGSVNIEWQERDAPDGEIATKGRELHLVVPRSKRVGPLDLRHA